MLRTCTVFLNFRLVILNLANFASNFLLDALCETYKTIYNSFKYNTTCSLTAHPILLTSHLITSNTIYAYIYDILHYVWLLTSHPILYMLTYITSYTLYAYLHHFLYSIRSLTSLLILDMLTYMTSYYTEGVFTSSGGTWCIYSILTLFEGRKDPSVSLMVFLKEVKCLRILRWRDQQVSS